MRLRLRQMDRPQCGSGGVQEDYNLPLHVGALFIILTVSASACAFALVVTKVPALRINPRFLFAVRHFGTGVLLATAFVHLLPTAFISLTDPCLPGFWNDEYPAMAGAIALASVFAIATLEMVFSPGRHCGESVEHLTRSEEERRASTQKERQSNALEVPGAPSVAKGPLYGRKLSGRSQSNGRRFSQIAVRDREQIDAIELAGANPDAPADHDMTNRRGRTLSEHSFETLAEKEAAEQRQKALMQCVMLEVGILFHSVFIGMALAVAVGRDQIVLLIAIVFHQSFEGLALGSRIAAVGWKPRALQPWIMALAYGCTTPLGQALGIATRNLYDPQSQTGLLVVGIMNAISSGLLTFNSLIDLLSEDFLSDHSWKTLRGNKRIVAFSLVFCGAFCMALIGAWA